MIKSFKHAIHPPRGKRIGTDGRLVAKDKTLGAIRRATSSRADPTILGRGLLNIALVIGVTSWPATALLIRAQTLSIRERPYLERARVLGAGRWHQITRHVLPNVMPMVFANTTLTVAVAILTETTLSFLGLGDPTRVSWGSMLDNAFSVGAITTGAWWYIVPPGVCVVLVVLAFTLVGQALEDVFNPQLRER